VETCLRANCFKRVITYSATVEQIAALIGISRGCSQEIKVYKHIVFHIAVNE
jgi:hypothetical protein